MKVAGFLRIEVLRFNGRQTIRHRHCLHRSRSRNPRGATNQHRGTIRQPICAAPARNQQVRRGGIPLFRINRGVLMEDFIGVGVESEEAAGDIPLVGGDDGVLGHVLDLVGLGVRVRDGGVLVVFVGPFGAAGEGLVREEGAKEVQGVGGFVDMDVDVGEGVAEEDEVAAAVVGVPGGVRERHDVPVELAGMDRKAAEGVDQIGQGAVAVFVITENPDGGTLSRGFYQSLTCTIQMVYQRGGLTSEYLTFQDWISAGFLPSFWAILLQSVGM